MQSKKLLAAHLSGLPKSYIEEFEVATGRFTEGETIAIFAPPFFFMDAFKPVAGKLERAAMELVSWLEEFKRVKKEGDSND